MKILLVFVALLSVSASPKVTQKHLDSVVKYWQGVLSLQDWEIRAHTVRLVDLDEGTLGVSRRDPNFRVMQIGVLDPRDYAEAVVSMGLVSKTDKEIRRDIDDTILHEIVHLRLRELVQADVNEIGDAEEVTVNRITSALERAKR